jgi:hypothetical protein
VLGTRWASTGTGAALNEECPMCSGEGHCDLCNALSEIHELRAKVESHIRVGKPLAARVLALTKVVNVARKLKAARDERHQRTLDLQALAAAARAGGPSGTGVLNEYDRTHPTVWDIGDVTEEICEAIDILDGKG